MSALRITVGGLALGTLLSVWTTRVLEAYLFGVTTADPVTYAVGIVVLLFVSLGATARPAHAAATLDPMVLLRCWRHGHQSREGG